MTNSRGKRIDLFAPPFRGHLHPVLAMARELKLAGHEVCVFSTASAQSDIEAAGVACHIFASIDDIALRKVVNPPWKIGHSPLKLKRQFQHVLRFFTLLEDELQLIYATREVDLIIADFTLAPVGAFATQHQLRWWTSLPSPCVLECKDGPPAYFGGQQPATSKVGVLKHWLSRQLIRVFKQTLFFINRRAIAKFGLSSVYRQDGAECIYSPEKILCLGDPAIEFAKHWPAAAQFIGPQLYSPTIDAQ